MSRKPTWISFLPEHDVKLLKLRVSYEKKYHQIYNSWYYKVLPQAVKDFLELSYHYNYCTQNCLTSIRSDYAHVCSENKVLKENAEHARRIKAKYNEYRRKNAKIQK